VLKIKEGEKAMKPEDKLPGDLVEFMGTECTICEQMEPLVQRLMAEEGVEIHKLEIWHNQENANLFMEIDQGNCGGVPFFYNRKTGKWVCGKTSYEKFKKWALEEKE
jgi:thiol-disulfide isomerase/thioredoxin